MKSKKIILLVLATILMLGLAVVAVITSLKLKELSTVPVAPNAPISQPQAADNTSYVCQTTFTVTETQAAAVKCTTKVAYKTSISTANELSDGAIINRGDTVVYQINYENTGTADGVVTISDTLSDKLQFVGLGDETACAYSSTNRTITCANVPVAAGKSGSQTVTVKVLTDAAAGDIVNSAVVTPSTGTASTCSTSLVLEASKTSKLACTAKNAYRSSISTANKLKEGDIVNPGDVIVYQVNYENTGTADGTITISDTLSNKLEYVSASDGSPCTYANSSRTVTCSDIAVAAGKGGAVAFTVKVLSNATAGDIGNTAIVTPSEGDASTCAIGLTVGSISTPTPTPTGTPTVLKCNDYCANTSDCPSGYTCSWNKCRNAECPDDNDCSCAKPPGCNEACNPSNLTNECVGGYVCDSGTNTCRNSSCLAESDCTCAVAGTVVAPQSLPKAGSPVPGFLFLGAGAILLVLGILVVGL